MPDVRIPPQILQTVLPSIKDPVGSPADLGVLRGVVRGLSEEARASGFPSASFDGLGFFDAANDLSIVAAWRIGSRSAMS